MSVSRIILSINVRWWNAEAAYALNLAEGLIAAGHRVWMIVNPGSPVHRRAEEAGVPVLTDIHLDAIVPTIHIANLRRLLTLIDREGIQIINSFKSNGSFLFTMARRLRPQICFIKTRGEARPPRRTRINRYLYGSRACDGLIAVGSPVKRWIEELEITGQRMTVIRYGDAGLGSVSKADAAAARREFGIEPQSIVLTLLGRTQRVKGHRLLLEALAHLNSTHCHALFLVKDLKEFPLELQMLEEMIDTLKLRERVTILGFRKDLARVLSITDLGVIPSLDSEVNCRVAVEFFSLGIPVLSFPTGTLPDIVRHQQNGYLTSAKTAVALANALQWMIEDGSRLSRLGEEAKKDFETHYTRETMTRDTLAFYGVCCD